MNMDALNDIILKRENEHIEFKAAKSTYSYDRLLEYTIALANERGGKFVLGVTNKVPRNIEGTKAFEELNKIKEQLIAQTRLRIEVDELLVNEKRVLIFNIPSRPIGVPLHLGGRYLMRAGEALVAMTPDMLQNIFSEAGPDYSAETCKEARMTDLDTDAIEEFRKRWINKSGNQKLAGMPKLQLLNDAELIAGNKITYAALILFGTFGALGRYLGQAEIVFEYRTNDAAGPAQQRIDYREGFFSVYDKLWETINLRNTEQHFQDRFFMVPIKTFNERAIREAILNAVSHRDYRLQGSIFVRQYPERIEIASPGGLPDGINFENILWQQAPRNRRLADTFLKCGLVERSGQGMNLIYETSIKESKGIPDFDHSDEYNFWITLHGRVRYPEFLKILEKIGQDRVVSFSADDLIVLLDVYDNKKIAGKFVVIADKLYNEGLLERAPKSSGAKWILARKLYSAIGQRGVHTRKQGLDRSTNKELLIKHIRLNGNEGAKFEELQQVLPNLSRKNVQVLLKELHRDGTIVLKGKTKGAVWFLSGN